LRKPKRSKNEVVAPKEEEEEEEEGVGGGGGREVYFEYHDTMVSHHRFADHTLYVSEL
jgi:hypothetical protein